MLLAIQIACGSANDKAGSPEFADEKFFEIRDSYQETEGKEKQNLTNAAEALTKLHAILTNQFHQNAWYLAIDICRKHGAELREHCEQLTRKVAIAPGLTNNGIHLIIGQSAIVFNPISWQPTATQKEFCDSGAFDLLIKDKRYGASNAIKFIEGLKKLCAGDSAVADILLGEAYRLHQLGSAAHLELFRDIIAGAAILNSHGVTEAMKYLTYRSLLKQRNYETLKVISKGKSITLVDRLMAAEIINPYDALSPNSDKNSLKTVKRLALEISNSTIDCKTFVCNLFASESARLTGEAAFVERNFESALAAGERCIKIMPDKSTCLSLILASGLSLARPDIYQKYSTALSNQLGNSFLFREQKHTKENSSFNPSSGGEGSGERLPNHRITKIARKALRKMLTSPYLKGKILPTVEVTAVDYENAEVFSAGGRSEIFLGTRLIDRILKKIQSKQYRADLTEEDIIAVVLGHELHHVVAGDPLFRCSLKYTPEYFGSVKKLEENRAERESKRDAAWNREYDADEMGALYAFLTGHRAGALLHVLADWAQRQPVMKYYSSQGDPHPPHLMRVDALSSKIQILQTVANAFTKAEEHLRVAEKLAQTHNAKNNAAIARHLEQADYGLDWVAAKLPGHEALVNNRAVIKIQRAILEDTSPEVPVYPRIQSRVEFVAPVAPFAESKTSHFSATHEAENEVDVLDYIYKFRPSLAQPFGNYVKAERGLTEAKSLLESALQRYHANLNLAYNLAYCNYYLAQLHIRKYHEARGRGEGKFLKLSDHKIGALLRDAQRLVHAGTGSPDSTGLSLAIGIALDYARESDTLKRNERPYCESLRLSSDVRISCADLIATSANEAKIVGFFERAAKYPAFLRVGFFHVLLLHNRTALFRGEPDTVRIVAAVAKSKMGTMPAFWQDRINYVVTQLNPTRIENPIKETSNE